MHGLWAEDAQKRNIFPPIHTPPPGSPHIWLRLPRCLLGRDIFWQVARASDGGHWFYPRKESGPSFLLSTTMGMASRICPPRFSTCARTTLHSPLPPINTPLFSSIVRAEYRPRTRSIRVSFPPHCPTFPAVTVDAPILNPVHPSLNWNRLR